MEHSQRHVCSYSVVLWSKIVDESGIHGGNHFGWAICHMQILGIEPGL